MVAGAGSQQQQRCTERGARTRQPDCATLHLIPAGVLALASRKRLKFKRGYPKYGEATIPNHAHSFIVSYAVKEIFLTLQGEGAQAGRTAVFCRFAGCNLWSGREQDRSSAQCQFCDTDFVGTDGTRGNRYASADALTDAIESEWGKTWDDRFVVLTGGEPLLQVDAALIEALHARGFSIAVETNGTIEPPQGLDWICVSPKAGAELHIKAGNELKLVFPQAGAPPHAFEELAFDRFSLQPMDGPKLKENTALAIDYCRAHPRWRLSIQMHKLVNIR